MREELRGHHRADRVAAQVLGSGGAAPVPVESGERIGSTWLELRAQHISVTHACSISTATARAQDQRPSPVRLRNNRAINKEKRGAATQDARSGRRHNG